MPLYRQLSKVLSVRKWRKNRESCSNRCPHPFWPVPSPICHFSNSEVSEDPVRINTWLIVRTEQQNVLYLAMAQQKFYEMWVYTLYRLKKEKHFCAHKLYTSKTPTIKTLFKGNKMFFFFSFMGHWSYNKMWKYWNGLFFKINVTVVCSVYAFSLFKCVIFLFDSYSTARSVCVFSPFTLQCQVWAC